MSNSFDPDQAQHFVGPDLGPKCLHLLSVDDTSRQNLFLPSFSCYRSRVPAGNLSISSADPAGSQIYTSPENEDPVTI